MYQKYQSTRSSNSASGHDQNKLRRDSPWLLSACLFGPRCARAAAVYPEKRSTSTLARRLMWWWPRLVGTRPDPELTRPPVVWGVRWRVAQAALSLSISLSPTFQVESGNYPTKFSIFRGIFRPSPRADMGQGICDRQSTSSFCRVCGACLTTSGLRLSLTTVVGNVTLSQGTWIGLQVILVG